MTTRELPVSTISDGPTFSVRTYFDVCPESPDGRRVASARFTGGVPGRGGDNPWPGVVVVAERDGD